MTLPLSVSHLLPWLQIRTVSLQTRDIYKADFQHPANMKSSLDLNALFSIIKTLICGSAHLILPHRICFILSGSSKLCVESGFYRASTCDFSRLKIKL